VNNKAVPLMASLLFIVLASITVYRLFFTARTDTSRIIVHEVKILADILHKIDAACQIIDFDYQKNWINFLTIKKGGFVGSELGSMNLTYPNAWEGPYLEDNPTIQDIEYQVVRTKKGYFVVPGEGVRLANGKIIGKDIILNEDADITTMMSVENILMYKGKALAVQLDIGIHPLKKTLMKQIFRPDDSLVKYTKKCAVRVASC
jgi:hypothetical protein